MLGFGCRQGLAIPKTTRDRKLLTRLGAVVLLAEAFVFPPLAHSFLAQSNQSSTAAQSSPSPLTLDEVIGLIRQSKSDPHWVASAIERGVDFELKEKAEKKLRKAGADDELLA